MSFQFYCPNGHLLQANPEQVGQTCTCPTCQVEIIIPAPEGTTPPPPGQPPVSSLTVPLSTESAKPSEPAAPSFDLSKKKKKKFNFDKNKEEVPQGEKAELEIGDPQTNKILHSICPSGHILEIDRDMIGQQAMCPYCRKTFDIRLEKTVEYLNKKKKAEALADTKMARFYFQFAIIGAVLAVIFIVIMICLMIGR